MAGGSRPWTREEHAAALRESYATFHDLYPDRSYDSWRLRRQKPPPRLGAELIAEAQAPTATPVRRPAPKHPSGWEPGVAWDGTRGTVTTTPLDHPHPDWDSVLQHFGLDPASYEVVEPVQMRTWDASLGDGEVRQMWYYRASFRLRRSGPLADIEALRQRILDAPPRPAEPPDGDEAFVVALSDWQVGKGGTEATVDRILAMIDALPLRIAELRTLGRRIGAIYVLGLGDVVEGCEGWYAQQEFTVELDRRSQVKVARMLLTRLLMTLAPLAPRAVVAAVAGNHGENRKDGKSHTTFADNDDVAVFEQVAEILAANPAAYGHVAFALPHEQLTMTLDVAGTIVGLAHGHQVRGQGPTAVARWWAEQAAGMRPVGDAKLLFTGHFHYLAITEHGPRTHFQCPTMDSGSPWYEETRGLGSPTGTLTLLVGPQGWHDLQVLR